MRKMYFAMIPKKSFLEEVLTVAAVAVGVNYGAKALLGEEKYNEYLGKAKDMILGTNTKKAVSDKASDETAEFFEDDFVEEASEGDKSEDDILEKIKKAAESGVRKGVDKIFGEEK